MTRATMVAWADVPRGAVVWDASPEFGGDMFASVAVRFPAHDGAWKDGAWIVAHGNPTYSSCGGWHGTMYDAPQGERPLMPDFAWHATEFVLARDDGKVKVIATDLTAEECASLGRLCLSEVAEWARKRRPPKAPAVTAAVDKTSATE